eukprot:9080738-Pyramimonas_sp.AAC.2
MLGGRARHGSATSVKSARASRILSRVTRWPNKVLTVNATVPVSTPTTLAPYIHTMAPNIHTYQHLGIAGGW